MVDSIEAPGPGAHPAVPVRRRRVLVTLCLAVLAAQVDTAVVNLAVRPIGVYFSAGVDTLQWVVDSYNVVYAALLLSGGLLGDLKGRRRIFLAGAVVLTAASLACALAPSLGILIAARATAGLGAALLVPASLAIIRVVWPEPAGRARALGIWAACNGLAMALGPTAGGVVIDSLGWPAVFMVVVPLTAASVLLALPSLPEFADAAGRSLDTAAQVAGACGLAALVFATVEAQGRPAAAAVSAVGAVAALAIFVRIERSRGHAAMVPLDLFSNGTFSGAMTATAGMTFGMYGVLFLLPLTWQSTGRLDAAAAGIALMPMALLFVLVSPLSARVVRRMGTRLAISSGIALIAGALPGIGYGAPLGNLVPAELALALTGVGMGLATGPLMGVAVGAVTSARAGTAASLINVARMVGATTGVAVLGAVYAAAGGGSYGLAAAMLAGGVVQAGCAGIAWFSLPAL
ncbi:MFS transporter [Arhodomonas aquaeolei]|uniref:MFS transporter n=1 Tax=Arhodomonas aquaeolei TaxID=2369 RepID=UPI000366FDE9|nr:MFS transporter [Arhodomonas aquaeolei]